MPSEWPNGVAVAQFESGPLCGQWVIIEAVDSIHGDADPEHYRVIAVNLPITLDNGDPILLPAEHSPQTDGSADVLQIMRRDLPLRWSLDSEDIERAYRWHAEMDERIRASLPPKERRLLKYLSKHFRPPKRLR